MTIQAITEINSVSTTHCSQQFHALLLYPLQLDEERAQFPKCRNFAAMKHSENNNQASAL